MNSLFSVTTDRVAFYFPGLEFPVYFYGVFFALGTLISYTLFSSLLASTFFKNPPSPEEKKRFRQLIDSYMIYLVLGGITGARLGDVFFYDWALYRDDLLSIFFIRDGGLSSHGGIFLALVASAFWWVRRRTLFNFFFLHDTLLLSLLPLASFIRLGNLFNQEILGVPTTSFWGVYFSYPLDGSPAGVYYPVQFFESLLYFSLFIIFYTLRRISFFKAPGIIMSLILLSGFGGRVCLEAIKSPQGNSPWHLGVLTPGATLSLPFIFLGIISFVFCCKVWLHKSVNKKE